MPINDVVSVEPNVYKHVLKLMGNRFEITVVAENMQSAAASIDEAVNEIRRIETLLTTFSDSSQTNLVNRYAGIQPVPVDKEVFDLIVRSKKISELTQGAFDITYGSVDKRFWNFDEKMTTLPDPDEAKERVRLINYRNVILNEANCSVYLKEAGMRIGFGGIGKGYAADRAKAVLLKSGVMSGVVNAAGDLSAWGMHPNGHKWTIGIADPNKAGSAFSYLEITNMSIATSGNYEKFVVIDGKKYSHTIDPKTGMPVTGIKSVSVISPSAELSDAMATPIMIMGIKVGIDLVNQVNGLACIVIDDDDCMYTSKNIKLK